VESALSEGRDDEATLAEGGIGLGVAVPAEGNLRISVMLNTQIA